MNSRLYGQNWIRLLSTFYRLKEKSNLTNYYSLLCHRDRPFFKRTICKKTEKRRSNMAFDTIREKSGFSFAHDDLIADRVRKRKNIHFFEVRELPKGVKPHPDPISVAGGMPSHGFFPIESIDVNLDSEPFSFDGKDSFNIPDISKDEDIIDLQNALQYADTTGFPALKRATKEFVSRVVKPKMDEWSTIITLGGADGISKVMDVLVNPGDSVLFEEFTFTPILNYCMERGGNPVPIKLSEVMENNTLGKMEYADELEQMLSHWKERYPKLPLPKCLYTIPNGHNPLGVAQTFPQKKKIYALAEKYNFFIIEDEPYAYLNFSPVGEKPNFKLTNDEFINKLYPSYTTLDKSGRVCRLETFSKIFAPGTRLGYATGHPQFLEYMKTSANLYTRAPSGLSQAIVNDTIAHLGGTEGWIHWITLVRNHYLERKNALVKAIKDSEAGKKGYLLPLDPSCGMFVSCKINFDKSKESQFSELMQEFLLNCQIAGVLPVLGINMAVDKAFSASRGNFIRIAISYPDKISVLEEAAKRLSSAAIRTFEDL